MMKLRIMAIGLAAALLVPSLSFAGDKSDFQAAYDKAQSIHQQAGTFSWTTTADRLEAAKAAAEDGKYGQAASLAVEARELAELSLKQRKNQEEAWRQAVVQ